VRDEHDLSKSQCDSFVVETVPGHFDLVFTNRGGMTN
jgi:hypothetical protein